MTGLTFKQRRDKADTTTVAVRDIIRRERAASDSKVAKLKALRLARAAEAASATRQEGRKRAPAS